MEQFHIDFKVVFTCVFFYIFQSITINFVEIEIIMKCLVFVLTVGYTARR